MKESPFLSLEERIRLLKLAERTVRGAAAQLKEITDGGRSVEREVGRDLKVRADYFLEQAIREKLESHSDFRIVGEETSCQGEVFLGSDPLWIVDPLDGTVNYSRGLFLCCISVALWQGSEPLLGVIFDFLRGDLYAGLTNEGAWLNGGPIAVAPCVDTTKAILATGFPVMGEFTAQSINRFVRVAQQWKKIRMIGSAALSLAYVACGRMDAYWERDIMLWDVSAGLALVRSAGGAFRMKQGNHPLSRHVLATNRELLHKIDGVNGLT